MEKESKRGRLKRGFTTGTAAAAGAKAAVTALLGGVRPRKVVVDLPRGQALSVPVKGITRGQGVATATIIKDAGDDPDVTHLAEIVTEVRLLGLGRSRSSIRILGGEGVGLVTRPGLKIPPGKPAINPVPLKMIRDAVRSVIKDFKTDNPSLIVTVKVPKGLELAKKTMNERLGITGGISILGTTGIVEPVSLRAYRDSISCAIDVAVAGGAGDIVLSTGRTSERVAEALLKKLPQTAFILTGDHMGYALDVAAARSEIKKIIVAGQFGKFSKLARASFETHCSDSSVEPDFVAGLAAGSGASRKLTRELEAANTARHAFFILKEAGLGSIIKKVCDFVKKNSSTRTGKGVKVEALLVGYDGKIEARSK